MLYMHVAGLTWNIMKKMMLSFIGLIVWLSCHVLPVADAGSVALVIVDIQICFLSGGTLAVEEGNDVIPIINSLRQQRGEFWDVVVLTQDWHCADHVSFASQHPGYETFEVKELFYNSGGDLCIMPETNNGYAVNCTGQTMTSLNQTLWPDHCVKNTQGADISTSLITKPDDITLHMGTHCQTDGYSVFFDDGHFQETGFHQMLQELNVTDLYFTGLATDYCVRYSALDAKELGYNTYVVIDATRAVDPSSVNGIKQEFTALGIKAIESDELLDDSAGWCNHASHVWMSLLLIIECLY